MVKVAQQLKEGNPRAGSQTRTGCHLPDAGITGNWRRAPRGWVSDLCGLPMCCWDLSHVPKNTCTFRISLARRRCCLTATDTFGRLALEMQSTEDSNQLFCKVKGNIKRQNKLIERRMFLSLSTCFLIFLQHFLLE